MPDTKRKKATPRKPTTTARKPAAAAKAKRTAKPRRATPKAAAAKPRAAPAVKAARKPAAPKAKAAAKPRRAAAPQVATTPKVPRKAKAPARPKAAPPPDRPLGPDPDGFFVARVRGEEAVREAPHQMLEAAAFDEETLVLPAYDEGLGELPWSYGEDALIALPRDPRTLFLYWDHGQATLSAVFEGLDHPRTQLWLFVRGAGWERLRVVDFALESRGWYLHDLEPGRVYRAEIHLVDRQGRDRLLPHASNPVLLPRLGPSPVVDDRFVRIPWEVPLPRLVGAGVPGAPFPEELRALLARLSDWARFLEGGGAGGRPDDAAGSGGRPTSPSSPFGPFGGKGR